ncbi:CLUMA_CG003875, isoform A [Clunio marinus]|uniref:CLUMA_CG003875, isoform A n=1 Tax=Clunio marinus TaxID=568069 RepID=A0A1J1HQ28_9DIPT|nr:CLUMA_CG003875, isoform A [Clunio marinus]
MIYNTKCRLKHMSCSDQIPLETLKEKVKATLIIHDTLLNDTEAYWITTIIAEKNDGDKSHVNREGIKLI